MRFVVCVLCLVGCGFELRTAGLTDAGVDAPPSDVIDADLTPRTLRFREGLDGYAGTLDSYISNNVPGPHGAETEMIWDLVADEEHALLAFTQLFGSGATQIPPGSTIMSASLRIVIVEPTASIGMMREVVVAWDETTTWATFGGAAGVQPSDVGVNIGPAPTVGPTVIDVTASVTAWSANPAASYGWLFSPGGEDGCDAASSESTTSENRPTLDVSFIAN